MTGWFEDSILGGIPQYRMVKTMAEGLADVEEGGTLKPVLVFIDDVWQLAYRVEDLHDGWSRCSVPQAPTPMSATSYSWKHRASARWTYRCASWCWW